MLRPDRPLLAGLLLLGACQSQSTTDQPARPVSHTSAPASAERAPLAAAPATAEYDDLAPDAGLDAVLVYAAAHSAALRAAFERWRAAVLAQDGAGSWPDPRLTYGYYLNSVETRTGPMRHQIGLSQTFPWFGRSGDAEEVAASAAERAERAFDAQREALFRDVRHAWANLYVLERSISLTRENSILLQNFIELLGTRYMLDAARHPDLIRVQLELGKVEDQLAALEELRPVREAQLNSALGRPSDSRLPTVTELDDGSLQLDDEQLIAEARRANPQLLALSAQVQLQHARVQQADRAATPDWTINLGYTVLDDAGDPTIDGSGSDPVLLGFSVGLPVYRSKYRAATKSSRAAERAARADREDLSLHLEADLRTALYRYEDADRRVRLYRETLAPRAEESLQATLIAFEADRATMLDLLDTQRTLLEFGLSMEHAYAERAKGLADLRALVGGDLPTGTNDTAGATR